MKFGVHQGSTLSYFLFATLLDELAGQISSATNTILFEDNIMLVPESLDELKTGLHVVTIALEEMGPKVSIKEAELVILI